MRKGPWVPEREFPTRGYCDIDRIYDGREVRCAACGRRVRFTVSRHRGRSGYHELSGACVCGRFKVEGTVDIQGVRPSREGAA